MINKIKPFAKAGGWLLFFIASSVIVIFGVGAFGIATNNEYVIDGLISYEFCMEAIAGTFSMESLLKYGYHLKAANFTMVLLFLSYLPVLAAAGVKTYRHRDELKPPKILMLLLVCFAAALLNLVLEGIAMLAAPLIPASESDMLEFVMLLSTGGSPWATLIVAGILAPIVEEVVLRKGVQKSLQAINPIFAIVVTSIIFGILHGNLVQGIFAGVFGLALGYVYYKTDNLAYSIAMHITVNLTGCLISVLALPEMPAYAIVAALLVLAFIIAYYRKQDKNEISVMLPQRFRADGNA